MLNNFKVLICDDSILARKQLKDIISTLGNPTFIENGKNGMLLPYNEEWTDFRKEEVLTKAIIELFTKSDVDSFNKKSYQIAEPYLTENVAKQWKKLVGELVND